jgi:DNA-binding IclR family transcriptional regulator
MGTEEQYFSKTLEKGLKVLALFNEQRPEYSQTEISKVLGLNMTSTYRLINTLVKLGYLKKNRDSKKLRLGLRALVLSTALLRTFDHHRMIRSAVDDVHEKYNVTVDVALAVEDALSIVYRREAEETLTHFLPTVNRSWHTTSLGKAYLAFLPPEDAEREVERLTLEKRTPNSITDKGRLMEHLAVVRKKGYATANEEFLPGLLAIGAPLINPDTGAVIGAVSFDFSTIQHTVKTMERDFAAPLLELSRTVSEIITTT